MLLLGQISALSVRMMIPHVGAWVAECDLDLGSDLALPTGKVTLTVGTAQLVGTVDPRGTGRFGEKASARVVGGGNGWASLPTKQNFHNDAGGGVKSSDVLTATANSVGETAVDNAPFSYGADFDRVDTRPASQVLDNRLWHVDAQGVTQVGLEWPALTVGADVEVLTYDPKGQVASFASDELVWPGTTITDARFGSLLIRSTDQTFSTAGSRGSAYIGPDLSEVLESMVEGFSDPTFVKAYLYRISIQGSDGRLRLQAVNKSSGVPDTLPMSVWPGIPGVSAKYVLGSTVLVIFPEGDRTKPRVVHFDGTVPLELHLDATTLIELGAGATAHIARGDHAAALHAALVTFSAATTLPDIISAFAVLKTALQPAGAVGSIPVQTLLTTAK